MRPFDAQSLLARHGFQANRHGEVLNGQTLRFKQGDVLGRLTARMTSEKHITQFDQLTFAEPSLFEKRQQVAGFPECRVDAIDDDRSAEPERVFADFTANQ